MMNKLLIVEDDISLRSSMKETIESPNYDIFVAVHQAVVDWLIGARPKTARPQKTRQAAYEQHAAIFENIRRRDVEGGDQAVKAHLQHLYATYFGETRQQ